MKSSQILALLIALVVAVVAGCNKPAEPKKDDKAPAAAAGGTAPADLCKTADEKDQKEKGKK